MMAFGMQILLGHEPFSCLYFLPLKFVIQACVDKCSSVDSILPVNFAKLISFQPLFVTRGDANAMLPGEPTKSLFDRVVVDSSVLFDLVLTKCA